MQHQAISGQPVLKSERLTLRPLQRSDKGLLELYAGDERVARSTPTIPHPFPPGAAEALIARAQAEERSEDVWAMDGSGYGLGELVGLVSLQRMEGALNQSEISYWVAPAMWNTGLASEAVRSLVENNPQSCATIFASVQQSNPISARVLTNAGFEYLGDAEAYSVATGGPVPIWTYLRRLRRAAKAG